MNPYFSKDEAMAIISIVIDVVLVDGRVDPGEDQYVGVLANKFGLSKQDVLTAQGLAANQVAPVLSRMSYEKRKWATTFLMGATMADGFTSRQECQIASMIMDNCNLVRLGLRFQKDRRSIKAVAQFIRFKPSMFAR